MNAPKIIRTGSATLISYWLDDNGEKHFLRPEVVDAWVEENTLTYGCLTREDDERVRALYDFD